MTNDDPKISKKRQKFICEACNYSCFKQSEFNKHLATRKHEMMTNVDKMMTENLQKSPKQYQCECGKVYAHKQGLSVHRKNAALFMLKFVRLLLSNQLKILTLQIKK